MDHERTIDNDSQDAFEAIRELEKNTSDEIKRQRVHTRLEIKSKVIIQHGNASQRHELKMQAMTGDLSSGGCQILCPYPPTVGDIYLLNFNRDILDLPPTLSRCVRCRYVADDAFEAGFAFFNDVNIAELQESKNEQLLV